MFDPEKYALSGSEDASQIAIFGWAALPEIKEKYPELKWLFAIPNGGFRTKAGAGKLKAMGVKAGFPDIGLLIRRGEYAGIFVELKKPKIDGRVKGKPSPEQLVWGKHLQEQGFGFVICHGFLEAREMLIKYLEYGKE